MSDSWPIVDIIRDIVDPATELLVGQRIDGREVVHEDHDHDEFGNDIGPEAGRLT